MVRGLGSGPGGFGKAVQKGWSIEFRRLVGEGNCHYWNRSFWAGKRVEWWLILE